MRSGQFTRKWLTWGHTCDKQTSSQNLNSQNEKTLGQKAVTLRTTAFSHWIFHKPFSWVTFSVSYHIKISPPLLLSYLQVWNLLLRLRPPGWGREDKVSWAHPDQSTAPWALWPNPPGAMVMYSPSFISLSSQNQHGVCCVLGLSHWDWSSVCCFRSLVLTPDMGSSGNQRWFHLTRVFK